MKVARTNAGAAEEIAALREKLRNAEEIAEAWKAAFEEARRDCRDAQGVAREALDRLARLNAALPAESQRADDFADMARRLFRAFEPLRLKRDRLKASTPTAQKGRSERARERRDEIREALATLRSDLSNPAAARFLSERTDLDLGKVGRNLVGKIRRGR